VIKENKAIKEKHKKKSFIDIVREIKNSQTENFFSLYKGFLASLTLVSNPIIQFVFYELLKKEFKSKMLNELNYILIIQLTQISALLFAIRF